LSSPTKENICEFGMRFFPLVRSPYSLQTTNEPSPVGKRLPRSVDPAISGQIHTRSFIKGLIPTDGQMLFAAVGEINGLPAILRLTLKIVFACAPSKQQ